MRMTTARENTNYNLVHKKSKEIKEYFQKNKFFKFKFKKSKYK